MGALAAAHSLTGHDACLPGALGARRKLVSDRVGLGSHSEWCSISDCLTFGRRGFDGCEEVVGAPADLACDGEPGSTAAAAPRRAGVELVVGAVCTAAVVGCFDERPAEVP